MLRLLVVLAALVLVNPWLASGVARGDDETRRGVVIYVNHLNAPGGNGQSWAQALPDLQAALAMAAPGDEIWVRHGTYKPTTGTDLTASFVVPNGVSLFGGFDGVETERAQADPLQNETILTGDLLGNDAENFVNYADNSRHIMLVQGVDNSTIIDGFVFRSGNSTVSGSGDGAAIFASPGSPLIRNCQFRENSSLGGGALAFVGPTSTAARLFHCTFSNNRATTRAGGAVAISGNHTVVVETCHFDGNSTLGNLGGGIAVSDSDVQIFNSTFTGNSSANGGGGVSVRGGQGLFTGTVLIAGCLFHDNLADNGGAVRWLRSVNTTYSVNLDVVNCTITKNHAQNLGGGFVSGVPHQINNLRIINCIVFGNTASGATTVEQAQIATNDVGDPARIQVHSSIVEGWSGAITSTATVGADPAFVDPLNDNFRVHSTSPAIDSGDNTFVTNLLTVDIAGFNRVYDQPSIPNTGVGIGGVDRGAYEQNETAPTSLTYDQMTAVYFQDAPITPNSATVTPNVGTSFTVSPSLPAGLTLDPVTGTISGAPSVNLRDIQYTVTAANEWGSVAASVRIAVILALGPGTTTIGNGNTGGPAPVVDQVDVGSNTLIINHPAPVPVSGRMEIAPGGLVVAPNGLRFEPGSELEIAGQIEGPVVSMPGSSIHLDGDATIGHPTTPGAVDLRGDVAVNDKTLVLPSPDEAKFAGDVSINGGEVVAENGVHLQSPGTIEGHGKVGKKVQGDQGSKVKATNGTLELGDQDTPDSVRSDGEVAVGPGARVRLKTSDRSELNGPVNLDSGTIESPKKIELGESSRTKGRGAVDAQVDVRPGAEVETEGGDIEMGDATKNGGVKSGGHHKVRPGTKQKMKSADDVKMSGKSDVDEGATLESDSGFDFKAGSEVKGKHNAQVRGKTRQRPGGKMKVEGDTTVGHPSAPSGVVLEGETEISPNATMKADSADESHVKGDVKTHDGSTVDGKGKPVRVSEGGNIKGTGRSTNGKTNNGGNVKPGHSPGTYTFESEYEQTATGVLQMEIAGAGPAQFDRLDFLGAVTLNGTLEVTLLDGFLPSIGESFQLFSFTSAPIGNFTTLALPMLPTDRAWDTTTLASTGHLMVVSPDLLAPEVAVLSPTDVSVTNSASLTVMAEINDASATTVQFSLNGAPATAITNVAPPGDLVTATFNLVEGANEIVISATDVIGNSSGTSVTVTLDTISPVVVVGSPAAGSILGIGPLSLSFIHTDATSSAITVQRLGAATSETIAVAAGSSASTVTVAIEEGLNTIVITSADAAGNTSTVEHQVLLDMSVPLISIDSPSADAIFGPGESPIAVIATVDDLTATTVSSIPGGVAAVLPAGGGVATGTIALTEGLNTIVLRVTDGAAQSSDATIRVLYDSTAPTLAITSPTTGDTVRGTIEIDLAVDDATAGSPGTGVTTALFLDGQSTPIAGDIVDTLSLSDGPHAVSAIATDGVGNQSSVTVLLIVDNTAPIVGLSSPGGSIVAGPVAVNLGATDSGSGIASVKVFFGDETAAPPIIDQTPTAGAMTVAYSAVKDSTTVPDGDVVVKAVVIDGAGNRTESLITVTIDNSAPVREILTPRDGDRVSGVISIAATASDPNLASLTLYVDGNLAATTSAPTLTHPFDTRSRVDGTMVIKLVARDAAGNETSSKIAVTVNNMTATIDPQTINLRSKGQRHAVTVRIEGPNLGLLMPTEGKLELKVPGGNAVPVTTGFAGDDVLTDCDQDGLSELTVKFDRTLLINSLRAGLLSGQIHAHRPVRLLLRMPGANGALIATLVVRIEGC